MAKKRNQEDLENQRASRKEILRKRKLDEQTRQVRIGVFIVAGLLAIIFVVAIINEFFIVPNQFSAPGSPNPLSFLRFNFSKDSILQVTANDLHKITIKYA